MDVMLNGSEEEKGRLSFFIMDIDRLGTLAFEDFLDVLKKIVSQWSVLTNSKSKFLS